MSTVDYSERDAEGKIIGPDKRVIIVDAYSSPGTLGLIAAMASMGTDCAIIPLERPERRFPSHDRAYDGKCHERHQGRKERKRRLKRLVEGMRP